jgi:short-subunit dehydrogenase
LKPGAFQQANLMATQDVTKAGYKALMAGDRVIIPGIANKAMVFMRRLIPESLQAKMNEWLTDNVPSDQQKRDRGDQETQR